MKRFWRLCTAATVASVAAPALIVLVALVALAAVAWAEDAVPPAPTRWVTDQADFLSPQARQSLDSELEQYEQRTGHQFLVWIGKSSGNRTPEDFASKAFAAWRVGRKGIDDGLVLFVFADERKLRFEVGYGLESKVTDAIAGRILSNDIVPRLQADDRDGAISQGVAAATAVIDGTAADATEPSAQTPSSDDSGADSRPQGHRLSLGEKIVIGLLVIGFIILLITNPSLALWLLFNLLSSGGGGRGGSGGGGFSGGGGRSGGGGASGSW